MDKSYFRVSAAIPLLRMSAVLCSLFAATPLHAEPMTELEVVAAVETWLQGVITDARADATVEFMEPHLVDGETVAYIVHLAGGGFCLSGADDLVLPVYFYSPDGVYDPDNPGHEYILWEIGARLAGLRKALEMNDLRLELYQEALAERAVLWSDLATWQAPLQGRVAMDRSDPEMMVLPLTSTWGQGSPYNDDCPALFGHPDEPPPARINTRVGCVAIAMSQIMYYWKWPETGTSYHGHTWAYASFPDWESTPLEVDPNIDTAEWQGRLEWVNAILPAQLKMGGDWDPTAYRKAQGISNDSAYLAALSGLWSRALWYLTIEDADFGATTYDWDLMQDVHIDADGVDAGDVEVAKLCYQAGVAVRMNWGLYVSTSMMQDVAPAFRDYFRYDGDVTLESRDVDRMTTEIQWHRPVVLSGEKPGEDIGHAWVVHGYDKSTDPDRLFMMNLGWGSSSVGWYSVDDINLDYYANQKHVTWIAPKSVVRFVGSDYLLSTGSPGSPYPNVAVAAANAPDGATLIFKAGRNDTFAGGSLVIDRPFTLKGYDVTIQHE